MITPWDYIDTELPCTDPNRSGHMKNMGQMGWELISVTSNPATGKYVFFWKRPLKGSKNKLPNFDTSTYESLPTETPQTALGKAKGANPEQVHEHKFKQEMSASNYDKFPEPQIVMVVKYRPKKGCFNDFRNELYKRDYPNCIARHMGFNENNEFVCLSLMDSIDAALDLESVGTNWLDSVDHLLIKYPNGSRTESFSGSIWGWYPNFTNFKKFHTYPRNFSLCLVKMKATKIEDCKNLILQPSKKENQLFKCVAQYKDADDTFILSNLDYLTDPLSLESIFQNDDISLIEPLIIKEETKTFFSGSEDFVWLNKKYITEL